jgi:hypothetical protein
MSRESLEQFLQKGAQTADFWWQDHQSPHPWQQYWPRYEDASQEHLPLATDKGEIQR